MTEFVLDSSALLAWIWNEPGAERLRPVLSGSRLSAVNLAEVVQKLSDRAMSPDTILRLVDNLALTVEPMERADAIQAGLWRDATRSSGLSLGDRVCLALGKRLGSPVYTADRAWAELDLGVEVVLIR